ncbi:MAG: ATP-dependent DNA helicase RecG [Terriglobales bacterium]
MPRLALSTAVQFVPGVGPKLAELLAERGIATVEDLLLHLPIRYEDRSRRRSISELLEGDSATIVAQVQTVQLRHTQRGRTQLEAIVSDGTAALACTWYNAAFVRDKIQSGQMLALYGKLARQGGRLGLHQPEVEMLSPEGGDGLPAGLDGSLKLGRVIPVYEAIGPLTSGRLRRLMHNAVRELPAEVPEVLPASVRAQLGLPPRRQAIEQAHFPNGAAVEELAKARTPAQMAFILEELFCLQAGLEMKRRRVQRQPAPVLATSPAIRERLKQVLPFHPTTDQKQALREIAADLGSGRPMRRLLQGDVGSGKTIVALQAAVIAVENGFQVALMAPTQLLAEQHFLYARQLLPEYRLALVTSGQPRARPGAEEPQLAIGTQALIERHFQFSRLGLVLMDEQHRFGVLQRFHLMHKQGDGAALAPHVLVMTATPIPRTLALALYGDLDASLIRIPPPGALPIVTRLLPESRSQEAYALLERHVARGRQAYCVYPVIEEGGMGGGAGPASPGAAIFGAGPSPASPGAPLARVSGPMALKPALVMHERLQRQFPTLRVGLLHGRLPRAEKQQVMQDFRDGRVQVLVATTVIEVGVDVPNATLMIVEQAERFGIAQLHQLRGRIGRPQPAAAARAGAAQPPVSGRPPDGRAGAGIRMAATSARSAQGASEMPRQERALCVLVHADSPSANSRARLEAVAATQDGFALAEADLRLRGPGEFFGTRQSGLPLLQIAQPLRDRELMELARDHARTFLDHASPDEQRQLVQQIQHRWQRRYGLIEAG